MKLKIGGYELQIRKKMINPTVGPASISLLSNITAGTPSSGVYVTEITALNLLMVWACVQVLQQSFAICPVEIHDRKNQTPIETHPLFKILNLKPNPEMSAFQFRSVVMAHLGLWGNSFSEIERDNAGRPIRLWPIAPWRVYVRRVNGELMYQVVLISGGTVWLRPEDILHIRGLSTDGLVGLSPIRAGAEAIGLGLAAQVSAGKAFSNDNVPPGVITAPQQMSDKAAENLRKSVEAGHKGLNNANRIMLLEEGATFTPTRLNPSDAQLLESRKFTREEIASMYRVPPHKVGIMDRATFSNIEQQGIEFVGDTMSPWGINIAQEEMIKLLSEEEQGRLFIKHNMDELQRSDIKARYGSYAIGRQWGWLNADEIRRLENMPPLPNKSGQVYLSPMNMVPAGTTPAKPSKPTKE